MSDNIGYTPGSGATIAADNVGGALHQRVKVTFGADGAAVDASEANPLPVISYRTEQLLGRLVQATISPPTYDSALRRQRVTAVLESGTVTTVSTVSTVTTLSDQTNIGSRPALMLINQTNLSAWADCVRARIT
jgi:hypothetical protein